ncbi:DNA polymerase ligase-domain-containing protein [Xylaria sp. CBS 124048]|nr:DNA polymerase ligase-domain-containing protein [Xylaria sp. CBS 124048]
MARKRSHSPHLVPSSFTKKRNLEWSLDITGSRQDAFGSTSSSDVDEGPSHGPSHRRDEEQPMPSAIEAGQASIDNHLLYFGSLLSEATLSPFPKGLPRLSVDGYRQLFEANSGSAQGAHFVIHQHDHPIAGIHYDLRLQINETSSVSWAIMYGLPGDPNSFRLSRNATETRIHCLWNHLIETASLSTGSLLIWDTGTYSILPTQSKDLPADSQSSTDEDDSGPHLTEQEKLHEAFAARRIKLQLHGTRLPSPYVINLRLSIEDDIAGRARSTHAPKIRRQRHRQQPISGEKLSRLWSAYRKGKESTGSTMSADSDSGPDSNRGKEKQPGVHENKNGKTHEKGEESDIPHAPAEEATEGDKDTSNTEREIRELEDEIMRRTNAYTGANNSIDSVHQRRWFLSLDRESCGFVKRRKEGQVVWEAAHAHTPATSRPRKANDRKGEKGEVEDETGPPRFTYPFYVRGVEEERSVVTGRLGSEIMRDEGVVGYVARKGWQAILK